MYVLVIKMITKMFIIIIIEYMIAGTFAFEITKDTQCSYLKENREKANYVRAVI